MTSNWWRILFVPLIAGAVLTGCGDDDDAGSPEAQPSPDVTTFAEGDFDGIPLPPLAEPAGEPSERGGVVVRSYFVRNRTPEDVLAFYEAHYEREDVPPIASPEPFGNESWRGSWLLDGRELLVTATPAPTAGGEEVEHAEVVTQMSLELSPSDGGGHENDPAADPDS